MERTIGNLAQEIRLHNASVYANLSQCAVRRCQVNAIKVIIPSIEPTKTNLPQGSQDLGNGYMLLCRRERTPHTVQRCESDAILQYLTAKDIHVPTTPRIIRWARLQLPNGQVARSAWKELAMTRQPRMAQNVKLFIDGTTTIAEVLFYFNMTIHDEDKTFALVSEYGPPHPELLERSFQTVIACTYRGDASLRLIEVSHIQSVVAMIPHQFPSIDGVLFYLVERPGLDIIRMGGIEDNIPDED
ncbi:hypothetical protein EDB19DRAFT_1915281 [Suillus lakei]|nr:hypothetical protein EDB19DRAFT_1915281 [Suillus lakei]